MISHCGLVLLVRSTFQEPLTYTTSLKGHTHNVHGCLAPVELYSRTIASQLVLSYFSLCGSCSLTPQLCCCDTRHVKTNGCDCVSINIYRDSNLNFIVFFFHKILSFLILNLLILKKYHFFKPLYMSYNTAERSYKNR